MFKTSITTYDFMQFAVSLGYTETKVYQLMNEYHIHGADGYGYYKVSSHYLDDFKQEDEDLFKIFEALLKKANDNNVYIMDK